MTGCLLGTPLEVLMAEALEVSVQGLQVTVAGKRLEVKVNAVRAEGLGLEGSVHGRVVLLRRGQTPCRDPPALLHRKASSRS